MERIAISEIAFVAIASTLARRQREGSLSVAQAATAWIALHNHAQDYVIVPLRRGNIEGAGSYLLANATTVQLRSLDAVQLVAVREAFADATRRGITPGAFVASDHRLLIAAQSLGMTVDDPNVHP